MVVAIVFRSISMQLDLFFVGNTNLPLFYLCFNYCSSRLYIHGGVIGFIGVVGEELVEISLLMRNRSFLDLHYYCIYTPVIKYIVHCLALQTINIAIKFSPIFQCFRAG